MEIYTLYGVSYDSNIYVITGEKPSIIDCGTGLHHNYIAKQIKEILDPKKIVNIVLTHEHFDHCGGVKKIHDLTGRKAKIISHIDAAEKIEKGESSFARMLGGNMPKMPIDSIVKDNDMLKLGDKKFKVLHTPGHTRGGICLYNKEDATLFSGDTVFAHGSFGRYDFPGGDVKKLYESIKKISELKIVNLYPGHETAVEGDAQTHVKKSLENISYLI